MFCQRCGAAVAPGAAFCARCGSPATAPAVTVPINRPGIVTLLAVLQFIGAAFWFVAAAALILGAGFGSREDETAFLGIVGALCLAGAIYQLVCGIGLLK